MKRLFIQFSAAILLLLVCSFHSMGSDKYTLEYKLEKGKTYNQNMVSLTNLKMDFMGQAMDMDLTAEMSFKFDVLGQENGVFDVSVSYKKVKTDMSSAMMSFTLDTESPENSSDRNIAEIYKSFMEIPVGIQLTKQGKITSVNGGDVLAEKMNALDNEQYKQMVNQQFSEKVIQATFAQIIHSFPDKPVAIGDSWDVTISQNTNGVDIINKMKYTLKQVKDNVATIDCAGTLATPEGGDVLQFAGMEASVSMKGVQAGIILIDMKTGWIVRTEITQSSTMEMDMMGQAMEQRIEVKVTVTAD